MHWSTLLNLVLTSVMRHHLLHLDKRVVRRRKMLLCICNIVFFKGKKDGQKPPCLFYFYEDPWLLNFSPVEKYDYFTMHSVHSLIY